MPASSRQVTISTTSRRYLQEEGCYEVGRAVHNLAATARPCQQSAQEHPRCGACLSATTPAMGKKKAKGRKRTIRTMLIATLEP